jgi:hypothetical protein
VTSSSPALATVSGEALDRTNELGSGEIVAREWTAGKQRSPSRRRFARYVTLGGACIVVATYLPLGHGPKRHHMKALGTLALAVSLVACGYATGPAGGADELAGSQDRVAQWSLRNGIAAAKVCFTGSETYTGCTDAALSAIEPSLTFNVSPSNVPKQVDSVVYQTNLAGDSWAAAAMSDSGTCWWINDVSTNPGAGTFYGSTTTAADCTGDKAKAAAATVW